jgi:hypothetical protein
MVAENAARDKRRGGTFQQLVAKIRAAGNIQASEGEGEASQENSKLKKEGKPSNLKSVSFLAAKGKLERDPQAEVTREERRDKSTSETKTIYKPKKRKAKDSESDDDGASVNFIDSEGEESHHSIVGMIKGLHKRMDMLSQPHFSAPTQSAPAPNWQQADRQQQQPNYQRQQKPAAGSWSQNNQTPPFQRGICFRFRDTGKCDISGCKFSHSDEGNTAARPQKQGPGAPYMHAQRQANLHQPQQVSTNLVPPCYAFQKGNCSRGNTCRFTHELQRPQRQQQQVQKPDELPPFRACRNIWATSTCGDFNCKFEHGSFDARQGPCKSFKAGVHCPYIFSNVGCRFSHARDDANQVPLGGARTQKDLLSKVTPGQKDH